MFDSHKRTALLDRFAMILSAACMVHCMATPFFVALLPVVGVSLLSDEAFHQFLLFLVVPASIWGLTSGCRRHRELGIAAIGAVGLTILISAGIAGHALYGEGGERMVTIVGSALVAIAHLMNYRRLRPSL